MSLVLTWILVILDVILCGVMIMEYRAKKAPFQVKDYIVYFLIILASIVAIYFLNK